MTRTFRTLALAVSVAASASVFAQAPSKAAGPNPTSRGDNVFYYGPLERSATISNPLAATARPTARAGARQVTPVPEPSQWAMMLAGLALVGFMVRRNSQRS